MKLALDEEDKVRLMRRVKTATNYRYGMGGRLKTKNAPKPITLPKLKCLEKERAT